MVWLTRLAGPPQTFCLDEPNGLRCSSPTGGVGSSRYSGEGGQRGGGGAVLQPQGGHDGQRRGGGHARPLLCGPEGAPLPLLTPSTLFCSLDPQTASCLLQEVSALSCLSWQKSPHDNCPWPDHDLAAVFAVSAATFSGPAVLSLSCGSLNASCMTER